MTVLTFSSAPVFIVVVSAAAYGALFLVVLVYFRMRALRKLVASMQRETQSHRRSQQVPTSSEDMSARAQVERWAHLQPAAGDGGGAVAPPVSGAWNPSAPVRQSAPSALPPVRANGEPAGRSDEAVRVTDPAPVTPAAIDRLPAQAHSGGSGPVTGGFFLGGNGKGQDRARVVFNPAPEPSSWYAYAVVCDGVGGIGDGAIAAETAMASFDVAMAQWLADHRGRLRSGDPNRITESLETGVRAAHIATRELSRNPLQRGSSTTLDAALVIPARDQGVMALVTHVGDGVRWTLDARGLHRLTDDPTTAPRPLGAELELSAELRKVPLPPGTRLVLTSDGFEAGLARGVRPGSADGLAIVSSIAATLVGLGSSSAEIAHCIGGLAAANSPDDVAVVVVG